MGQTMQCSTCLWPADGLALAGKAAERLDGKKRAHDAVANEVGRRGRDRSGASKRRAHQLDCESMQVLDFVEATASYSTMYSACRSCLFIHRAAFAGGWILGVKDAVACAFIRVLLLDKSLEAATFKAAHAQQGCSSWRLGSRQPNGRTSQLH